MGILNAIKNIFSSNEAGQKTDFSPIIEEAYKELYATYDTNWWYIKASDSKVITNQLLTLSDKDKVAFIVQGVEAISKHYDPHSLSGSESHTGIWKRFMQHLFKTKLTLDDEDIAAIANAFIQYPRYSWTASIMYWPTTN